MWFSSTCVGRREWVRMLCMLSAAALPCAPSAYGSLALPELPPGWLPRGAAVMRFLGLSIYEISLWASQAVSAEDWSEQPFALSLRYRRALQGRSIAERSLQEMQRQGGIDPALGERWLADMSTAFPDVVPGDRLSGRHDPQDGARFWCNGMPRGPVFDAAFSRRFFGIWLAPQTSAPDVRAQLLGLPR